MPYVIEAAGTLMDKVFSWCVEKIDGAWAGLLDKCNDLGNACSEKFSQLKSSVSRGISNLRPSETPSPTPGMEKSDPTPSVERETPSPSFSPSVQVQSVLSNAGFGSMNIACEDLGSASVGMDGVGCAANTFSRFATQTLQLSR